MNRILILALLFAGCTAEKQHAKISVKRPGKPPATSVNTSDIITNLGKTTTDIGNIEDLVKTGN